MHVLFSRWLAAQHLDRDGVRQQLDGFCCDAVRQSRDLREFLGNPSLEPADKLKVLDARGRSATGMQKTVRNFLSRC